MTTFIKFITDMFLSVGILLNGLSQLIKVIKDNNISVKNKKYKAKIKKYKSKRN